MSPGCKPHYFSKLDIWGTCLSSTSPVIVVPAVGHEPLIPQGEAMDFVRPLQFVGHHRCAGSFSKIMSLPLLHVLMWHGKAVQVDFMSFSEGIVPSVSIDSLLWEEMSSGSSTLSP